MGSGSRIALEIFEGPELRQTEHFYLASSSASPLVMASLYRLCLVGSQTTENYLMIAVKLKNACPLFIIN